MDAVPALDPYRPPRDPEPAVPPLDPGAPLATRWQRFGGAFIDGLLYSAVAMSLRLGIPKAEFEAQGGNPLKLYTRLGLWGYAVGAALLGLVLLQWFLITRRGQSLGKMVVRSRIVRTNGAPLGFVHGVALRNWVLSGPGHLMTMLDVPQDSVLQYIYIAVWLIGVLLIYRADRRCLHDHLANTKVIDVSPRVAVPESPRPPP